MFVAEHEGEVPGTGLFTDTVPQLVSGHAVQIPKPCHRGGVAQMYLLPCLRGVPSLFMLVLLPLCVSCEVITVPIS